MANYKNPIPNVEDIVIDNSSEEYGSDYECKKTVYFAFIDVLGFKQTFDENKENESEEEERDIKFADKFKEVFIYYFELMSASKLISMKETTGCYAGQTSDSLYFYSPREDLLVEYIKILLHFNLYAMSKDVFFRGGIAKGNLFIKEPYQFYGDSVIYSYLIEDKISRVPIIMIDENTYNAIKKYDEDDFLIKKDTNDRHYLNIYAPLHPHFSIDDNNIKLRTINKELILANIKRNLKKFEYDVNNYEKYRFLLTAFQKYEREINTHQVNE